MNNILKKTFKELSLPFFKEVYKLIDKVCTEYGVQFYLIGAQARDIHLLESNIRPARGTKDIDFAIMLPDIETYSKIQDRLMELGFEKTKIAHRMIFRDADTVIDLLPYGQIEEDSTVKFINREVEISVVGFKEVSGSVTEIEIEGTSIKVSPMAGIFILKLVSWIERPEVRAKDFEDIQFILNNYFELYQDRFYAEHLDSIEEIPSEYFQLIAGARLLGRDMNPILARSKKLKALIIDIIDNHLKGRLGTFKGHSIDFNSILAEQVLQHIKNGIGESIG